MLGLGLGLNKGTNLLSNLKLLTRNSDWAIWVDKATGTSKGLNSPATNPIQDLVGVVGKNLFDANTVYLGGYYDASGNYISDPPNNTAISIHVPIKPSTKHTIRVTNLGASIVRRIQFYDQNKNWISSLDSPTTFTTPSTAAFCRWHWNVGNVNSSNNTQLELGTVATAYEPYGKTNGLLQGFGFIPTSGYVDVVAPNGKTVTGIQGDGVNDVILLPSNAPNPTSGNFAFGLIVKTGANKIKYLLTRNVTNDADTQYAFKFDASGNLFVILEGVAIQIGTALSVGLHSIWLERDSGILKAFIDGVETYSGAHVTTLISRANTVMMASTTGAGTYTGFSNDILLASKYCDSNIATNRADWFKFDTKVYGL